MKKISMFLLAVIAFTITSCGLDLSGGYVPTAQQTAEVASKESAKVSSTTIPVPNLSYFQERRTIAKWAERWDIPNVVTYVYLVSYGNIIGYYVADGKPASTRSYVTPENTFVHGVDVGESYGDVLVEAPDIDGTYGENNSGIRFFTADGAAVEWGGNGATYLYSDVPLSINVPLLHK